MACLGISWCNLVPSVFAPPPPPPQRKIASYATVKAWLDNVVEKMAEVAHQMVQEDKRPSSLSKSEMAHQMRETKPVLPVIPLVMNPSFKKNISAKIYK